MAVSLLSFYRSYFYVSQELAVTVTEVSYGTNRGELYMKHDHEGLDLKMREARDTLHSLYRLWKRPVHLETVVDDWNVLLSFTGSEDKDEKLHQVND